MFDHGEPGRTKKKVLFRWPLCYPASPTSATIKNATFGKKTTIPVG